MAERCRVMVGIHGQNLHNGLHRPVLSTARPSYRLNGAQFHRDTQRLRRNSRSMSTSVTDRRP